MTSVRTKNGKETTESKGCQRNWELGRRVGWALGRGRDRQANGRTVRAAAPAGEGLPLEVEGSACEWASDPGEEDDLHF